MQLGTLHLKQRHLRVIPPATHHFSGDVVVKSTLHGFFLPQYEAIYLN
jgi:hypothetical protein